MPPVLFVCSLTVKPGGNDGLGRLERTPSLRVPGLEHGPLEASTPQGEDLPSPLGSQNSSNMVLKMIFLFYCRLRMSESLNASFLSIALNRMTLATPRLSDAALCRTASHQNRFPSAPRLLSTSMPTRMVRLSRAVQRASKTVRGHTPATGGVFFFFIFVV